MSVMRSSPWAVLACAGVLALSACGGSDSGSGNGNRPGYVATSLVSDVDTSANPYNGTYTDANLVNAWGIAFNPQGFVWVANNGTSTSTLYDGHGVPQSLVVSLPAGTAGNANPTGIVFNGTEDFVLTQGAASGASRFLFVGESGTLMAWAPNVDTAHAATVYDGGAAGAIYKGLALASQGAVNYLYAADFHNGSIDVFDTNFAKVNLAGHFSDATLPAGYAPFNVQALGGQIYVAYAKQDAEAHDEIAGAGLGVVDVFDTSGRLAKRLIAAGGKLDAPWGMAMAPAGFGAFSNALLVGNFGDGKINAFDPATGAYLGTLSQPDGTPIAIDGLWGIAFGNGLNSQPATTLFFAAGPAEESHGVYGRIDAQ